MNPTAHTYGGLDRAYAFFNERLFGDELPRCLITMQRKKGAYGYFAPERFGSRDGSTITDEIALNPAHFAERDDRYTLSTLAHEMAHLWQQHFGTPSRGGYHNKEWASKMHEIGLQPMSADGSGKETGQRITHEIKPGGAYDLAHAEFAKLNTGDLFVDRWADSEKAKKDREAKAKSKTAFACPACEMKAWAKESARLVCGECDEVLLICG